MTAPVLSIHLVREIDSQNILSVNAETAGTANKLWEFSVRKQLVRLTFWDRFNTAEREELPDEHQITPTGGAATSGEPKGDGTDPDEKGVDNEGLEATEGELGDGEQAKGKIHIRVGTKYP